MSHTCPLLIIYFPLSIMCESYSINKLLIPYESYIIDSGKYTINKGQVWLIRYQSSKMESIRSSDWKYTIWRHISASFFVSSLFISYGGLKLAHLLSYKLGLGRSFAKRTSRTLFRVELWSFAKRTSKTLIRAKLWLFFYCLKRT